LHWDSRNLISTNIIQKQLKKIYTNSYKGFFECSIHPELYNYLSIEISSIPHALIFLNLKLPNRQQEERGDFLGLQLQFSIFLCNFSKREKFYSYQR
jgi:hypothetical protein